MPHTLELERGTALVLVAHPDDETIWMGGTMLRFPHVRWTVMSLCRSGDADRAPKFRRACGRYGARAIISDLEDEGVIGVRASVPAIRSRIRRAVGARRFTYLFTHGYNGEYGHPRHRGVHRAAKMMLAARTLRAESTFYFAYRFDEKKGSCLPERRAPFIVRLRPAEHRAKKAIVENMYGFSSASFESTSSAAIETFTAHTHA
ncbi:MAG: hypothetical protein A3A43_02735 [Candidatus Liptonbacteria bacterium RIFCSPLOWO2_01_FULL_56_20]|uniref:GlcNAc-PI de-N-acetylase n=1 Tax=Candidatus Liptonbacteria bacterium RIFCSPLOWO2_01_FULL_56_20 TaxID=1798652 RepID=A0A1G2CJ52_9BACT|nr:MAG: LmbE family protein [Parcubacteria group bacterium GW2011_GWB1_56_8]OGY97554.1 MAG: hypothetical protein A2681_00660 [Candidatus Liptonbacteria bacterium RIFCSPHIGHO2_01_FULL_56_18b]OGZ00770.1 MAG: hypothetical protein A3A43_02735 [Candidatus Liptonbacteria bacterium RIFCSPLOWO2_01_FULL_56_20]